MAEQGLVLKHIGFFSCEFEKCAPQKRRYRILDKSYFSMNDEEKGIYEDAGWKYVPDERSGVTIFTTDDEDAPELFSDKESFRKYKRNKWIGSIVLIIVWTYWAAKAIWNAYDLFQGGEYSATYGRLHDFDGEPLYLLVVLGLLLVIITGAFLYSIIREIQMIRYNAKTELPQYDNIPYDDKRYLWEKKANKLWTAAIVIVFVGLIAAWIGMKVNDYSLADGVEALKYNGEHPVMLREIDPDTWAEAVPMIENWNTEEYVDDYDIDYMTGKDTGGCFSEGWREQLYIGRIKGEAERENETFLLISTLHSYFSGYYVARSELIAEEYLGEEVAYDLYGKVEKDSWSKALEEVRIECDGVDYAGYYTTEDADAESYKECQHLMLRKGKVIEIVSYQGPVDLRDKIKLYVDDLS
jgi:hypothetical protein